VGQVHNQLYRGIWSAALKNAVGDPKGDGGLERFGETLQPTIDLWQRPEWAFLREEHAFMSFNSQAAVAAEFSIVAWTIPAAARTIAVIEAVNCRCAVACVLGLAARSVVAATLTLQTFVLSRDTREVKDPAGTPVKALPIELFSGSDPSATLGGNMEETFATATHYENFITLPYILKPGSGIYVVAQTVNTIINGVNIKGYLRNALPGELTL
jgi:hypothetical protein